MLAVVEIIVLMVVAVVLITTIISVGRPVAEMLAGKMRFKYDALGSEAEQKLRARVTALEEEVRQVRQQMGELKATADFAVKLMEKHESGAGEKIQLSEKDKAS